MDATARSRPGAVAMALLPVVGLVLLTVLVIAGDPLAGFRPAPRIGRNQDEPLLQQLLDPQARAALWRIHDADIEASLDQPLHQLGLHADLGAQRDVRRDFPHERQPLQQQLLPQPETAADGERGAKASGNADIVPGLFDRPKGCLFAPRCQYATEHSRNVQPQLREWQGGHVRCHYPLGDPSRSERIAQDGATGATAKEVAG